MVNTNMYACSNSFKQGFKLLKSQVVNILAFLGHIISAETTQARDDNAGIAIYAVATVLI